MFYLVAAFFLSIMNLTSIKILLPEIMAELQVELNWLTWVVNAYTLPLAALIPVTGRLGDDYGKRNFFIAGVLTLGFGSALCGAAPSLGWLFAGRILQALGAALLLPNALALLLAQNGERSRGRILGIWGGIGATGAVIGPVMAGLLVESFSWRGAFIALAPLSLVIALGAKYSFRRSPAFNECGSKKSTGNGFDMPGALLLVCAIAALLFGLTLLPDLGWRNILIQLIFAIFVILAAAFCLVERRVIYPLLDPGLLSKAQFSLGLLVGFLEQFVMVGALFALPIFFNTVQGHGVALTALLLTPAAAAVAAASPLGGKLSDRVGAGPPIIAGMLIRAISFVMLSQVGLRTGYPYIAFCIVLSGIGFGLTTIPALNAVLSTVGADRYGMASGVHNMVRFIGSAAGTTAGGIVLYALLPASYSGLNGPIPGFYHVYILQALACLPGILAGIKLTLLREGSSRISFSCKN